MTDLTKLKDLLKNEVIDTALDDWLGLYEIIWALNSLAPDVTQVEKRSLAAEVARELIKEPRFQLVRVRWSIPKSEVPLARDQETMLEEPSSWDPPSEGEEYLAITAVA
ncbi:MAG: hypothetical protein WD627_11755 [Actinomycetota bacterium]